MSDLTRTLEAMPFTLIAGVIQKERLKQRYSVPDNPYALSIEFVDKKANLAGLQVADLVSTPIGRHVHRPQQHNRAFEMVRKKFGCSPAGEHQGWGYEVFPQIAKGPGLQTEANYRSGTEPQSSDGIMRTKSSRCKLASHRAKGMRVKAQLARRITELLVERGIPQTEAAALLGVSEPKLSNLLCGQFRAFSVFELLKCFTHLGYDVHIVIRPSPDNRSTGTLSMTFR